MLRFAGDLAEPFYAASVRLRNLAFDRGWRKTQSAHCPVISVGNLTTGGTGKTPAVMYIVSLLQAHGLYPAVILRGYKAADHSEGDEAALLRQRLDVPVIVNANRVAAAAHIQSSHPEVNCVVLDDAFQHRAIARDVDLVLIDATNPLGYGRQLPRGMLRESPKALGRATAVIVTRADHLDHDEMQKLDVRIRRRHRAPPAAHTVHDWTEIVDDYNDMVKEDGACVVVLCGIGNPDAFLRDAAARFEIAAKMSYPDHHAFGPDDVRGAIDAAEQYGARAILTTEKDWMRLQNMIEAVAENPPPIWMPRVTLRFLDGKEAIDQLVLNAVFGERDSD